MSEVDIDGVLREFEPIHRQIAQPEGKDAIVISGVRGAPDDTGNPAPDAFAIAYFCVAAEQMLAAGHGFPDSPKYAWIAEPQRYRNSFEAHCQGSIVNLLIGLWERSGYRCCKRIIVRNEHTGGFHVETYETANAYFACISYQFSNLLNRYSLLSHYLIEIGQKADALQCVTPTSEVGGQAIERALCTRWSEVCPHLDTFLHTVAKASSYEASEVLIDKHVAAAMEEFYTDERYAHLRDGARLMAGPFYLPAEVMWTMYADQALTFTLAHELMHISNRDLARPERAFAEEMTADMGAADLLGYITVSTARRRGYQPSMANIIVGPIIFFALARVFAYFDSFEEKYRLKNLNESSMADAMIEEMNLLKRSLCVAALVVGGGWAADPGEAPFWNITGELRLLEIALRRRLWELSGMPLVLPLETEIALLQDTINDAKRRTQQDVESFRQSQKEAKSKPDRENAS